MRHNKVFQIIIYVIALFDVTTVSKILKYITLLNFIMVELNIWRIVTPKTFKNYFFKIKY